MRRTHLSWIILPGALLVAASLGTGCGGVEVESGKIEQALTKGRFIDLVGFYQGTATFAGGHVHGMTLDVQMQKRRRFEGVATIQTLGIGSGDLGFTFNGSAPNNFPAFTFGGNAPNNFPVWLQIRGKTTEAAGTTITGLAMRGRVIDNPKGKMVLIGRLRLFGTKVYGVAEFRLTETDAP